MTLTEPNLLAALFALCRHWRLNTYSNILTYCTAYHCATMI